MTGRQPPLQTAASTPGSEPAYEALHATRTRLRRLARLLDSGFTVPLLRWRIGAEALIGLIPGIGDVLGALFGSYFVVEALRVRAPRATIVRMVGNVLLDLVLGVVPVAGDLADFMFKSNERNLRLLEQHLDERLGVDPTRTPRRRRWTRLVAAAIVLIALAALWWWRGA